MCSRSISSRGFTLLELLVVIMLISLVTSFTLPAIRTSLFTDQLKETSRKLIGMVTEVSQEAVRRQSEYLLYFDLDKDLIRAAPAGGSGSGSSSGLSSSKSDKEEDPREIRLNIPESIRIVDIVSVHGGKNLDGTAELYFSKKGYVDKTAIHLRSDDGDEMTIILSPFMGVTRVFDSYVDLEDDQGRY